MVRFSRLPLALASDFFSGAFAAGLAATSALDIGAPGFFLAAAIARTADICLVCYGDCVLGVKPLCGCETSMPLNSTFPLVAFVALMLLASLQALSASGHFPKASRLAAISQGSGPLVLWASMIVTAGSVIAGIATTWMLIPWYAAVIGGGGAILLAPLILQVFPDRVVDGKAALIGFAGAAASLAALLYWLIRA
jgi:hypothetical protein